MKPVPAFSAPIEEHTDWLEVAALRQNFYSWSDYQRDLRLGVSADEADKQLGAQVEPFERLIDDISTELSQRFRACGSRTAVYPFEVLAQGIEQLQTAATAYRFQLALTAFGRDAGPPDEDAAKLFENLASHALSSYMGGHDPDYAASYVFGFPRRVAPAAFGAAVDDLCRRLGEGAKHKATSRSPEMKDAGLDVVSWRGFPDRHGGQLIIFGQCATGLDMQDKLHLQPGKWCRLWLKDQPLVSPLPAFFTPRRIPSKLWTEINVYGGMAFDRCRVAWYSRELNRNLVVKLSSWTDYVMRTRGAANAA